MTDTNPLRTLLTHSTTIAVVGLSPKEDRASNSVARYLLEKGYTVIPVNPGQQQILGQTCYPDLQSIPGHIDIIDIFRKSEDVLPIVEQAIHCDCTAIWMQLGIKNQQAADLAQDHNLLVIMDKCIKIEHARLLD